MSNKILIVEDDQDINQLLAINLKSMGHDVEKSDNGAEGYALSRHGHYDLIILDLMLPELDGLEICRRLRGEGQTVPIMMLTAKDSELDRVLGLEMGADDYLTKPFSIRELQARVKAQLRRRDMAKLTQQKPVNKIRSGELLICPEKRIVKKGERLVDLTSTEFDLLFYLASHPGMVFKRAQLLDKVWGYQHAGYEHTVNSHINRLRSKIEVDPAKPDYVLTVWGVGYKFNEH